MDRISYAGPAATAPATPGAVIHRAAVLVAGDDADVITLSADPLADIMVLTDQASVVGVWSGGRQVKGSPAP